MMEAQRYPKDFDGIVAGAPAFNWTGIAAAMVQIAKVLYPDPKRLDNTALTKEALQKLQQGIIDQCDAQDGLRDGIIQDPASAHFDLAKRQGANLSRLLARGRMCTRPMGGLAGRPGACAGRQGPRA